MSTISLCMIVKNEEDVLERCLKSVVNLMDEIIIVDTGSTDKTKEIAGKFTDKVFDFQWIDDFSAARNFSLSKATMDYQMWLDADDIIDEAEHEKFLALKKELSENDLDLVFMKYIMGLDNFGNPSLSYYRERIFKRSKEFRFSGVVHEAVTPFGKTRRYDLSVRHSKVKASDSDRNIRIYEKFMENNTLSPRDEFYYGRELMYHKRYDEAIKWFLKFISDGKGWVEDNIEACLNLYRCYHGLKNEKEGVSWLFKSFAYDIPHGEVCCKIGNTFMDKGDYKTAIFWFKTASGLDLNMRKGFTNPDCYSFIPFIELCVCYDKLGDREKALFYHEKSKKIKPKNPSVLYNEKFFYG